MTAHLTEPGNVMVYAVSPAVRVTAWWHQKEWLPLDEPLAIGRRRMFDCNEQANCWRLCLKYSGGNHSEDMSFLITSIMDVNMAQKRLKCRDEDINYMQRVKCVNETLSIEMQSVKANQKKCTRPIPLYYESHHDGDKISDIKITTKIGHNEPGSNVVLDPNSNVTLDANIPLFKNCGIDNECKSTLVDNSQSFTNNSQRIEFRPGNSWNPITLQVYLTVSGDPSYNTNLFIRAPPSAVYENIAKVNLRSNRHMAQLSCYSVDTLYKCPLGNPLEAESHKFNVMFNVRPTGLVEVEHFSWHVNNTNDEAVQTKTKHSEVAYYIDHTKVKVELENDGQTFNNGVVDPLEQRFPFNQRFVNELSNFFCITELCQLYHQKPWQCQYNRNCGTTSIANLQIKQ